MSTSFLSHSRSLSLSLSLSLALSLSLSLSLSLLRVLRSACARDCGERYASRKLDATYF